MATSAEPTGTGVRSRLTQSSAGDVTAETTTTIAPRLSDAEYVDVYLNGFVGQRRLYSRLEHDHGQRHLSGDIVRWSHIFSSLTLCLPKTAARSATSMSTAT